jgi:hypothetical protein
MDTLLIIVIIMLLVIVVPVLIIRASQQRVATSEPLPDAGGYSEAQPEHASADEQLRGGRGSDAASVVAMAAGTALIARAASDADEDEGAADGDAAADAGGEGGSGNS